MSSEFKSQMIWGLSKVIFSTHVALIWRLAPSTGKDKQELGSASVYPLFEHSIYFCSSFLFKKSIYEKIYLWEQYLLYNFLCIVFMPQNFSLNSQAYCSEI